MNVNSLLSQILDRSNETIDACYHESVLSINRHSIRIKLIVIAFVIELKYTKLTFPSCNDKRSLSLVISTLEIPYQGHHEMLKELRKAILSTKMEDCVTVQTQFGVCLDIKLNRELLDFLLLFQLKEVAEFNILRFSIFSRRN